MFIFQSKKLPFGGSPKTPSLPLYDWIVRYKNALVSKFSLYFFDVLSQHGGQMAEVKTLMSRMSTDYYAKFVKISIK